MSQWYPVIHYGLFFIPAAFVGLAYVLRWQPTVANIIGALALLIVVPALYKELLQHTDAAHEALALAAGFLAGYVTAFVGRFLRRRSDQRFVQLPPYEELASKRPTAMRPWDALPQEARTRLRAPGDLGLYEETAQVKPLPLKGCTCDIRA